MNEARLVDVTPIINSWNEIASESLAAAKVLMDSGNYLDRNKGIVKERVANLVTGMVNELMSAPVVSSAPQWVSVNDHLPEFEDDEPFVRCIVNVIRWSEGWTGLWNQPEPTLNEEEFTAAATYNPEQKIFTVYDGFGGSMVINALLSPDDCGDESGCRVTHWMEHPAPVGFWNKE